MLSGKLLGWLSALNWLPERVVIWGAEILSVIALVLLVYLLAKAAKWVLSLIFDSRLVQKKFPRLLDGMHHAHFLGAAGYALSAMAIVHIYGFFLPVEGALVQAFMMRLVGIYGTLCFMFAFTAAINVVDYLYGRNPNVPLRGVFQAGKIIVYLLAALVIVSIIISKKPMYVITGLSAAAAVFMLIFKDPILGFAAGIQLASNKLLKIGDWITMPSHGADGTVIDITLTTVRVQNFDNTIVNVPAYDLVSRPFQNWSGMVQSGARRIKRAINIDVGTVKFLDEEMLARLSKIELLESYLQNKIKEVQDFNKQHKIHESFINGRHLTNLGTFRQYATEYLSHLQTVDAKQTCMVRQLDPEPTGLPLEIYCFAATTDWLKYERIQADIFDHLYAVMPEFGLYPFQQPAGRNVSEAGALLAKHSDAKA